VITGAGLVNRERLFFGLDPFAGGIKDRNFGLSHGPIIAAPEIGVGTVEDVFVPFLHEYRKELSLTRPARQTPDGSVFRPSATLKIAPIPEAASNMKPARQIGTRFQFRPMAEMASAAHRGFTHLSWPSCGPTHDPTHIPRGGCGRSSLRPGAIPSLPDPQPELRVSAWVGSGIVTPAPEHECINLRRAVAMVLRRQPPPVWL